MADHLSTDQRSALMRSVKQKNTGAEMVVRQLIHRMGVHYRLHRPDLPGRPDLAIKSLGICIFVHGCFWHRHLDCRLASTPSSNVAYWEQKFRANMERDFRKSNQLTDLGWRVEIVWECETRNPDQLRARLRSMLLGEKSA